jgi:hypothetical protein
VIIAAAAQQILLGARIISTAWLLEVSLSVLF